ncbi:hypothetical protein [uncultured Clostridium sp.]|uniref:hypothetical protein n=1 Tax=uncultured Clostridium sp. TaxID=59620 RepID=UPI00262F16AC|nr:hypothetical protein [uncultured Clostridium sp.]
MFKKGIVKCFEAFMYDNEGNVLAVDENLTSASLTQAAEEAEIKNGMDNSNWSVIHHSKTLEGELQSNVLDIEKLALQAGSAITKGATTVHTSSKVYGVKSKTITLEKEPLVEEDVKIINLKTDEILGADTDYTITGATVTFTSLDNQNVKVLPYKYESVAGAKEIVIAADKFASACKLLLKSVYIDEDQNITHDVEVEIPKIQPSSNWTLTTQADFTSGIDNTLPFKAIKDSNGNLGYIRFIPRA